MSTDLISFELKPSRSASGLIFGLLITLMLLLNFSHIQLSYKLFLLCSLIGYALLHGQIYFKARITKCDLLLHLNNAILWQGTQSKLVNTRSIQAIGNYLIIIRYLDNNKPQNLLIFYDSITLTTYKELMRHIRWKQLKHN
jgi:Membrane-bound toxin component of toxin-antitoxin system